jgi:hypothetical protein
VTHRGRFIKWLQLPAKSWRGKIASLQDLDPLRRTMSPRPSQTEDSDSDQTWTTSTPPNDEENVLPLGGHKEKEKQDPNVVDWDGDADPANPRNWSKGYKSWITFQLGMLALAASLGSSIIAPGENAISQYVGVSKEVTVLTVSLYM